ncbi:13953_t:CDS:10, partial [Dentiscutata heterogama]
ITQLHAKELEALKHRWNEERTLLKESSTKTKAYQLAELEMNHKELENSWKQEKETFNKKLRIQKDSYEREIKSLQKEIEKLISNNRSLDEELQSVTANKKALTLEKAALTKEKNELSQQLDNLQKESNRHAKKNTSINELETRLRRLQKEKEVTSERATQKIKDLQGELQTEKEKTSKLNKEKNAKESLESDIRDEKEHIKALEVEIQNITDQLQSERRDHQSKNEQLSRYEDELQAVQEQCNRLRDEMEQLQDNFGVERNQYKLQLQRMEASNKRRVGGSIEDGEIKTLVDEISRLKHELSMKNSQLQKLQESAQNEINSLQEEIQSTQQQQLALIEKMQVINSNNIENGQRNIPPEYQKMLEEKDAKYRHKYQSELISERMQHVEDCKMLLNEVRYLKAKCYRESRFRADLCYQKKFLLVLLGGMESCEQATLLLISDLRNPRRVTSPLLNKFRSAVIAILAIQRMRDNDKIMIYSNDISEVIHLQPFVRI